MTDTIRSGQTSGVPLVPLGLLFVALLALCGAVVYPFQQLFWQPSPMALLSIDFVLPARVGVVAVGLFVLGVVMTAYSVVLLLGRL